MKKILVLLMALLVAMTLLTMVACGEDTPTTSDNTVTSSTAPTSTTPSTPGSSGTPVVTTTPTTTLPQTPGTTVPTTTAPPATPNMRDPAKEYHVETETIKTNIQNEDYDYIVFEEAGENQNERFADGTGYILYQFDASDMIEPTIVLKVRQMYKIYITDSLDVDMEDCTVVADFIDTADQFPSADFNAEGAYTAGTNITEITVDPYKYNYYGQFYIWIVNAMPEFGWGGTISEFRINQYVEGPGPVITTIDNSPGTPNYKSDSMVESVEELLTPGADKQDDKYIFENTSATNDGLTRRYCDGNAFLIYRIDLRQLVEPTIELYVVQNYRIEISADGQTWHEIANYATSAEYQEKFAASGTDEAIFNPSGDYLTGDNFTTITIDPYNEGEGYYGNLYIRISDCFPSAGWGGAIEKLTIKSWVEN